MTVFTSRLHYDGNWTITRGIEFYTQSSAAQTVNNNTETLGEAESLILTINRKRLIHQNIYWRTRIYSTDAMRFNSSSSRDQIPTKILSAITFWGYTFENTWRKVVSGVLLVRFDLARASDLYPHHMNVGIQKQTRIRSITQFWRKYFPLICRLRSDLMSDSSLVKYSVVSYLSNYGLSLFLSQSIAHWEQRWKAWPKYCNSSDDLHENL